MLKMNVRFEENSSSLTFTGSAEEIADLLDQITENDSDNDDSDTNTAGVIGG